MEQKTLLKNKKNQGNGGETMAKRDDSVKKKVPELRFKGFTDDWEERKLGDITKISTGKLDANAMVENGKYDFYTSGIKKYRTDVAAFEGPSITIAGNGATVGYMHLADNKFNAYQRTYVLQEFLVDRSFIFSEIGNKLPKKIKQEARTGNIPYIVMDMLTELKLSIPQNNSEQQKIGSFFKQLDETIALHQRKLDLLKEQKKGFLQKMFPKNGEKVPELRFAGFADDWEQRKFKDIIEKLTGGASIKPSDYLEEGIRTIPKGAVNSTGLADLSGSKYISEEFYESNKSSHVSTNNLVTSLRDLVPSAPNMGRIVRIAGEDEDFLMPQGVYKLELFDGMDEEFLIAFSNSDKYRKIISSKKNGSTQVHIRNEEFLNIDIELPFSEEQKQIGSFFKQLDNSIALHQRKLDLLKEQKKGFLQKMFV